MWMVSSGTSMRIKQCERHDRVRVNDSIPLKGIFCGKFPVWLFEYRIFSQLKPANPPL